MANGYVKRCSTSPVTQEMQFKTITGEQLTPVGRFIIKKTEKKKHTLVRVLRKGGPRALLVQPPWKTAWRRLGKLNLEL